MRHRLIDNPNLFCGRCLFFYKKHKKIPLCKRSKCPIEDAATDPRIEWIVGEFLKAKEFSFLGYAADIQKRILKEAGLLDDVQLLYSMERIYAQFQVLEAQKKYG